MFSSFVAFAIAMSKKHRSKKYEKIPNYLRNAYRIPVDFSISSHSLSRHLGLDSFNENHFVLRHVRRKVFISNVPVFFRILCQQ